PGSQDRRHRKAKRAISGDLLDAILRRSNHLLSASAVASGTDRLRLGLLCRGRSMVVLLSANAGWVFSSKLQGLRALVTFILLYFAIFLLSRAEDYALLTGTIISFFAVAAAMYLTRKIDWYSPLPVADGSEGRIIPPVPENTGSPD